MGSQVEESDHRPVHRTYFRRIQQAVHQKHSLLSFQMTSLDQQLVRDINKKASSHTLLILRQGKTCKLPMKNTTLQYDDQQTFNGVIFATYPECIDKDHKETGRSTMRCQTCLRTHLGYGSNSWITTEKSQQQTLDGVVVNRV